MKDPRRISDEELAAAIGGRGSQPDGQESAQSAFAEFYSRHAHRAYHYILRMTGDADAAQDILQEIFLRFQSATRQDLVPTNPPAYLMMIARNLSLNWCRDSSRTVSIDHLTDLTPHAHDRWATTVARQDDDELLQLITLALDVLEPEYREAFVLKYYQNYSYEEMAQLTGESIAALRNRVWRAKERIKRTLRPYIRENQVVE